ncbi:MAG TPA: NUDIX hydrolase, partial [Aurantimonas coralicida]|nr:NUDIX hydrolase [Aurantimonas coralicida]
AVDMFAFDAIPWDELAFPSVHWALNHDREAEAGAPPVPFGNPDGATGNVMPDGRTLKIGEF